MSNSIFIKSNNIYHKIEIADIDFIQSDGNYVIIQTDDKHFSLKKSLVGVLTELNDPNFIQIHKRFVVNKAKIISLDSTNNELFMGKETIVIGRTFKANLIKNLRIL